MLKSITGTFITRVIVSVINFAIIILTAKLLGAEARGSISLGMIAIAMAGLVNEIVGGPAVVYLIPRFANQLIARWAYLWAIFAALACCGLMAWFHFYDTSLFPLVCLCSIVLCAGSIHQFILLGHQRIMHYNIIALVQSLSLIMVFLMLIFNGEKATEVYFYSLLVAYGCAFLIGLKLTSFIWLRSNEALPEPTLKLLVNNGLVTQLASITHLMSSRIVFYYSSYFLSLAFVGVLSTAVSITEAALMFSSSVALITASTVSNEQNKLKAVTTTVQLIKVSILTSCAILMCLALIPDSVLSAIFGKDFTGIKTVIFTLIPGAMAASVSQVISHYYSGLGKFSVNARAGFLSLMVAALAGLLYLGQRSEFLPGIIISLSGVVAMFYFVRLFLMEHQLKWYQLLPTMADIKLLIQKLRNSQ